MKNTLNASFYDSAAQGRSDIGIWIAGALCCLALYIFPQSVLRTTLGWIAAITNDFTFAPFYYGNGSEMYADYYSGQEFSKNIINSLIVLTVNWVPTSLGLAGGIYFTQKYLRLRPVKDILTAAKSFRWKRALAASFVYLGLTIAYFFIRTVYLSGQGDEFSLTQQIGDNILPGLTTTGNGYRFLLAIPFVLIFGLIYTAAQEMLFRGFLVQGLNKVLKNQNVAIVTSACIYALSFFTAAMVYGGTAPLYLLSLVVFAIALSFLANMDNGLEAAIGFSFTGIVFYTLIIGYQGDYGIPTWLLNAGPIKYNLVTFATDCAFYFIAVYILSIWRWGISEGT